MAGEARRAATLGLEATLLFALYVLTARLGLSFFAVGGVATPVWAPTGIALGALTIRGRRLWPVVAAAAFAVNASIGLPLWSAALIACGNTMEALIGSSVLRLLGFERELGRLRDVLALLLVALGSTTVSATVGFVAALTGGLHPREGFGELWAVWWVGDVMGALLVAPAIFVWSTARPRLSRHPLRWIEGLVLGVTLVLMTQVIFHRYPTLYAFRIVRGTYALFPPLIWAALRFEQRGTTAALLLVAILAVPGAASGTGPFSGAPPEDRLVMVQFYMGVTVASMLTLGAALAERRAALRARDEFISIASHELKTPLTALRLRVASAIEQASGWSNGGGASVERLARTLDACDKASRRLVVLTDDLLDVSRLAGGRFPLHLEPCAVMDVVEEAVGRLRDQAAAARSSILVEGAPSISGVWDCSRLEQVLTNLLSNAIKYGDGKPIHVRASAKEGWLTIQVQDGGQGIALADQERIFRPFERVEDKKRVGGMGLGLYIGRQIAIAHGGRLTVQSAPPNGASFSLELPLAAPASAAARTPA